MISLYVLLIWEWINLMEKIQKNFVLKFRNFFYIITFLWQELLYHLYTTEWLGQ